MRHEEPPRIQLLVDDPAAAEDLHAAVDAHLGKHGHAVTLTVDLYGEHLPVPIVYALIGNLRRLREIGGTIAIHTQTEALRDALTLYGLDHVFAS
jgi:hypothetical protein